MSKIPQCIRDQAQWCCWKILTRDGDKTKVPFQVTDKQASSTNPETWTDFSTADGVKHLFAGLGFVFSADDPFCGVDFDGCRDPGTREVAPWAKDWITRLNSYSEVSPSGTGVKVFVRAKSPADKGRKVTVNQPAIGDKTPAVELYDWGRYFAVTGQRLSGVSPDVEDRQAEIDALFAEFFDVPAAPTLPFKPIADWRGLDSVMDRARKYLARLPLAVSGQGGHNATFHAACCLVLGFNLDELAAHALMQEWNQNCNPPWSERDLQRKVAEANRQPGDRGYLRDVKPTNWERIDVPQYKAPEPKAEVRITTLQAAAEKYLHKVTTTDESYVELGIPLVDYAIGGGVEFGELIVMAARPSHGKAQPLDSNVLTPSGWVPMDALSEGDRVIGADGKPTTVVAIYPQGELDVYRVTASDGESCECCADHLWFTQTRNERRRGCIGSVKPLSEILTTIKRPDGNAANHAIPALGAVEFTGGSSLRLHPYLMGLLLGDGDFGSCTRFCKPELDVQERLRSVLSCDDEAVPTSKGTLRIIRRVKNNKRSDTAMALASYGLDGCGSLEKFIPPDYLMGSVADRLELLRGLLDTDGHVTKEGTTIEFASSSPRLAEEVAFLARSLGAVVRTSARIPVFTVGGERKNGAPSMRVYIRMTGGLVPVSSVKHLARWRGTADSHRSIASVEFSRRTQCQCIRLAASDGLYVTDGFIVTHNSAIALQCVHHVTAAGMPALFVSEEMSALALGKRTLQWATDCPQEHWRTSGVEISRHMSEHFADRAPCYVIESCGTTDKAVDAIFETIEKHKVKLVVVDYAQLLAGKGKGRYEQTTNTSIALRKLATETGVVLLALCQLNREVEKRVKFIPVMSDVKDTGQFEQDADVILFLAWPHRMDSKNDPKEYIVFVAKNRNRPINQGMVKFEFLPSRQMFVDDKPMPFGPDDETAWDNPKNDWSSRD